MKKALAIILTLALIVSAFTLPAKAETFLPNTIDEVNAFGADITSINGLIQYLKNGGEINFFNPMSDSGDYIANLVSDFLANNVPFISQDAWKTVWQVGTYPYGQTEALVSGDINIESGIDKIVPTWDKFVNWITGNPQSLVIENKDIDVSRFRLPTTPQEPTYTVDEQTLNIVRCIKDVHIYDSTFGTHFSNALNAHTAWNGATIASPFDDANSFYIMNSSNLWCGFLKNRTRLLYNTTNNTLYLYKDVGGDVWSLITQFEQASSDIIYSGWNIGVLSNGNFSYTLGGIRGTPLLSVFRPITGSLNDVLRDPSVLGRLFGMDVYVGSDIETALPIVPIAPVDKYTLTLPTYNPYTLQRPIYKPINQPTGVDLGIDLAAFLTRIQGIIEAGLKNTITWLDIQDLFYYDDPRNFDDDPNNDILPAWTIIYVRNDLDDLAVENYGAFVDRLPKVNRAYIRDTGTTANLTGAVDFYYNIFGYIPNEIKFAFGGLVALLVFAIFFKRD